MNLLFVCTGNTCRSPLAVAAWQAFAPQIFEARSAFLTPDTLSITATSAGLSVSEGVPATPHTIEIAREWGIDLSTHRAQQLTADIADNADLICTMTPDQADAIYLHFGVDPQRVRLLGDFIPAMAKSSVEKELMTLSGETATDISGSEGYYIVDPYGGSIEAYQTCGAQIQSAVRGLAHALREAYREAQEDQ